MTAEEFIAEGISRIAAMMAFGIGWNVWRIGREYWYRFGEKR